MKTITYLELAEILAKNCKNYYLYKKNSSTKFIFLKSNFLPKEITCTYLIGEVMHADVIKYSLLETNKIYSIYGDLKAWLEKRPSNSGEFSSLLKAIQNYDVLTNNKYHVEKMRLYLFLDDFVINFFPLNSIVDANLFDLTASKFDKFIMFEDDKELAKYLNKKVKNEK